MSQRVISLRLLESLHLKRVVAMRKLRHMTKIDLTSLSKNEDLPNMCLPYSLFPLLSTKVSPELDEIVEPACPVVAAEDKHGALVHARHVAESLIRCVAQCLHLTEEITHQGQE